MKLGYLIARNCKVYFRDKSVFFASLTAPLILLFLYIAFLGNNYSENLRNIAETNFGIALEKSIVSAFAGGWLLSSLIAVCAVSIAFTANMVMVQDKVTDRLSDFNVSPVPRSALALGYFLSTAIVTMLVCSVALVVGYIYLACAGWYLSVADVFLTIADTLLLVLFGTALSSIVCRFLKSQGGITAVEATVSAAYGFLCGAYMPIQSLAAPIANTLLFLPGTYGTALLHEHFMGGAIDMLGETFSDQAAAECRKGFDCTL